jgi:uncharacterized protein YjiS (DUF1127 family)
MHDDDGGMTTLGHAPAAPIRSKTQAACAAQRDRAPTSACDGLAFRECEPSAARDGQHQASPLRRLVATIRLWRRRAQERRELLGMPDIELRDIGISRSEAWQAARKPVWRA